MKTLYMIRVNQDTDALFGRGWVIRRLFRFAAIGENPKCGENPESFLKMKGSSGSEFVLTFHVFKAWERPAATI